MKHVNLLAPVFSAMILLLITLPAFADAIIVVNSSVTETEVSSSDLQRMFLKKKTTWKDGSKIKPCLLKDSAESDVLMARIRRTSAQYRAYWSKKLFAGDGIPPLAFEDADEVLEYVAKEKGALCLVSSADVEGKDLKVLAVDGQKTL
jgi:ABC-type phosphate transport system substrate-binding protein